MMNLRWLGVAGIDVALEDRSVQILAIDPYFTRIPLRKQLLGTIISDTGCCEQHRLDYTHILVTHSHNDHLLDVPWLARQTGAAVYGSGNTVGLLRYCDVPEKQIHHVQPGETFQAGAFTVQVIEIQHARVPFYGPGLLARRITAASSTLIPPGATRPALRARDYRLDVDYAYQVTFEMEANTRLCLLTDPGVREQALPLADLLLLYPDHPLKRLCHILSQVQPRWVILTHWDDLWRSLSQPLRPRLALPGSGFPGRVNLEAAARRIKDISPETRVLIPEALHQYDISSRLYPPGSISSLA